ncbi:MAG: FKBP-type peptidyl-prolyl cis-trans isomerase [Spirochaetaceae bacterium]|jgi:FKBP-type peptidyl-prolyl cis-trans isomerase|nr:FKBP-type peptidyl-prolyl cis-trans isomerase [Spirochaetaceae bacterium]
MIRKLFFALSLFFCVFSQVFSQEPLSVLGSDDSYAFGVVIGSQLSEMNVSINFEQFSQGFYGVMTDSGDLNGETAMTAVINALSNKGEDPFVLDAEMSYAFGAAISFQLKGAGAHLSFETGRFTEGLEASINGSPAIPPDEAVEKIEGIISTVSELKAQENLDRSEEFMTANAKKSNVETLPSGLQYSVISMGSGEKPNEESVVTVNYEGRLLDGSVFDSSYERGEPAQFPLEDVIAGWVEGIQLMNVGSKFTFFIPPKLGYGDMAGIPIPPNSVLIFDVELLSID